MTEHDVHGGRDQMLLFILSFEITQRAEVSEKIQARMPAFIEPVNY